MTKEKFLELREAIKNGELQVRELSPDEQEDFEKSIRKYAKEIVAEKKLEVEERTDFEMSYLKVKGLSRPIRIGIIGFNKVQIDKTGLSIGEKVQRFLHDNTVSFQDIELEYDEDESTEQEPDWSGDSIELSEVDELSFDKVDIVDTQRELKDRILSAQMSQVEPGDIPSDKLETASDSNKVSVPTNGIEEVKD